MQAYFFGQANSIATILAFKSKGRLRIVETATKGVGPSPLTVPSYCSSLRFCKSNMVATINQDSGTHKPPENASLQATLITNIILFNDQGLNAYLFVYLFIF